MSIPQIYGSSSIFIKKKNKKILYPFSSSFPLLAFQKNTVWHINLKESQTDALLKEGLLILNLGTFELMGSS